MFRPAARWSAAASAATGIAVRPRGRPLFPRTAPAAAFGGVVGRGFGAEAAGGSSGSSAPAPTDLERAVSEQQQVLFPRLRELEEARRREDLAVRAAEVPSEEWSPRQLPYKVYEKDVGGAAGDSDADSDEDSDDEARELASSSSAATTAAPVAGAAAAQEAAAAAAAQDEALRESAPSAAAAAAAVLREVDGVQVGIEDIAADDGLEVGLSSDSGVEEQGFIYKGPEPTLYGDWQHKGRATDF